ncbi:RNA-metabolising metallo-beta-lactamase [Apiospora arundinis]
MFNFTSLQGARSDSAAVQSILELDGGVKVLVDVGWDETFDLHKLKELEKQVPTLSLVLLTHATISHLGAYAHCCKHIPQFTRIPVYATTPVISLGRTLLQELYASTPLAATTISKDALDELSYSYNSQLSSSESNILLQPPSHDEIATYFSLIHALKYSQPHQPLASPFSPPLEWPYYYSPQLRQHARRYDMAYPAWLGIHSLRCGLEPGTLAGGAGGGGAEVIEQLRKPTALVCSSKGATKPALPRSKRDDPLLETIQSCVANGGTVLIPIDSSARVLELAYLMEHAWRKNASAGGKLQSAGLYLAGRSIHSTMKYARSMLEWMDERIVQEFEDVADGSKKTNGAGDGGNAGKQGGPFDFKYLKLLDRKGQVDRLLAPKAGGEDSVGKVILASDSSLEWGFSRDAFRAIVSDPKNLLILTGLPAQPADGNGALASTFYRWWRDAVAEKEQQSADASRTGVGADGTLIQVRGEGREAESRNALRQPLEGDDLAIYRFWLAQQRQLQDTLQTGAGATLESSLDVDDVSSESSTESEDSETHQQGKALNVATTLGRATRKKAALADEDLGANILLKKKGVYDYDPRGKTGRDAMFPHPVQRRRADDYGEFIRLEDFVKAEERDEDARDGEPAGKNDAEANLGQKRKWADAAPNKGQGPNSDKRPKLERNASDDHDKVVVDGPLVGELDDVPDEEEDTSTGPYKLAVTTEKFTVNFNIAFIDFSGIHDKRSLHMLIPLIQPRKLILTGGGPEDTDELAADLPQLVTQNPIDIFKPDIGTSVDASADTNAYTVNLAPALVKSLRWQDVGGIKIATLVGRLTVADDSPMLDVPAAVAGLTASHSVTPFHVGDLRLANLRKDLRDSGLSTEFMGEGTLLVQNAVIVKKAATAGRISVEAAGWETETVQRVRRMVYEKLAVVGH